MSQRIGLLAGWGSLPHRVAQSIRAQGDEVCCIAVKDHCDPALQSLCMEFGWVGLAQVGRAVRLFEKFGVRQATMAGKIHKVHLVRPGFLFRHRPDWLAVKTFYAHMVTHSKDRKDDTMLGVVADVFRSRGVEFLPATDFAPELLVPAGHLAGPPLTEKQQRDVQFGWEIAKQMGGLDIGQSVCVRGQAVLAVEAIEGTDRCIERAGELSSHGGFTVIKVAKPNQDMRFDVPTIGLGTLETMQAAGARVLAVEAGQTILLDEIEFCRQAERNRISVVALASE